MTRKSGVKPAKSRRRSRLVIGGLVLLALAIVAGPICMVTYYSSTFPDPRRIGQKEVTPSIRVLARDGSLLAEHSENHGFMPIDLLPRHVGDAVISIEDRRFLSHRGIDPRGLVRAMWSNVRARRLVQGGSTVTQQLAKNLFLTPERTFSRKLEELSLALWLEWRFSKREILELYVNRVYYGAGAYGVEAAAQRYFGKSARHLSIMESAMMAGLLKAPSRYSPFASQTLARARARTVLRAMTETGAITAEQETKALRQAVRFANPDVMKRPVGVEYAVDHVLESLPASVRTGHGDIVVETTIDLSLQQAAQAVVERVIDQDGRKLDASQASVVVVDRSGGIRALVGGKSYGESRFIRAVKARRQPGSTFKPIVYLAALEAGMTPDSTVVDQPITIAGWSPRNDQGQYRGSVPLRQALAHSLNSVAVRLQQDTGARRVIEMARRLGIGAPLGESPSLALGTFEVTLVDLTGAYATIANEGEVQEPFVIRRVLGKGGVVLYQQPQTRGRPVLAAAQIGQINDMLNTALVSGTGRRAALPRHPAAGKTGTSQDHRDAWFVGYTAHLTAGVWVGNDNASPMDKVMGGNLPAQIWRDVMMAAHRNLPPRDLPGTARPKTPPDEQVAAARAPRSPGAAAAGGSDRISEAFIEKVLRDQKTAPAPGEQSWTGWFGSLFGGANTSAAQAR